MPRAGGPILRFTERLAIAAVLALAVVSGAQTAGPAAPENADPQVVAPAAPALD